MAETSLRGNPVNTVGDLPEVGSTAPAFELTKTDMSSITLADLAGQKVVLNIFPSLDTDTCAASVRAFNQAAASLENTTVLNVSADLPFAQGRFCGAEGIEDAITASTFRNPEFGNDYGTLQADGPLRGLQARVVIVLNAEGAVTYVQIVPVISDEPDYDAAIAALS